MGDAQRSLADRLQQRIEAGAAGLVSVYLFGSHAAGAAHRDSDVDVGVLLDWNRHRDRRDRFEAGLRLTGRLMPAASRVWGR